MFWNLKYDQDMAALSRVVQGSLTQDSREEAFQLLSGIEHSINQLVGGSNLTEATRMVNEWVEANAKTATVPAPVLAKAPAPVSSRSGGKPPLAPKKNVTFVSGPSSKKPVGAVTVKKAATNSFAAFADDEDD